MSNDLIKALEKKLAETKRQLANDVGFSSKYVWAVDDLRKRVHNAYRWHINQTKPKRRLKDEHTEADKPTRDTNNRRLSPTDETGS